MLARFVTLALCSLCASPVSAQFYNEVAGQSAPRAVRTQVSTDESGQTVTRKVEEALPADGYGNVRGNQYDLARDGAFAGQTVAVLNLCAREVDFSRPKAALAEKGFSTFQWLHTPPPVEELSASLQKSTQLWIISDTTPKLTDAHLEVIRAFFEAGHGVYVWGDNDPYYADANRVAHALIGANMNGNLMGDQVVGLSPRRGVPGILPDHLVTTGIEHLYEGITIATLAPHPDLKPLVYGSAQNLVVALYEKHGRRLILDGGFTRLYNKWDSAGTARYVKNAAAWLVNVERFPVAPRAQR